MTVGEKIKRIRTFRGMTQKELGVAIGFDEKTAGNRIAQYEMDYRVPKKDTIVKLAKALHIQIWAIDPYSMGFTTTIMELLFWLEEENGRCFHVFEMKRLGYDQDGKDNVQFVDNAEWPPFTPVGLYFEYADANERLKEYEQRWEELRRKEITRDEYFEWKINWPATCDASKGRESYVEWRKPRTKE